MQKTREKGGIFQLQNNPCLYLIWHYTKVQHEDSFQGVYSTQNPLYNTVIQRAFVEEKCVAFIFDYLTSKRGELWWPLVFSGHSSCGQTGKIQVGKQLEQAKR